MSDNDLTVLADVLKNMIEFRHGVIHRYDIDRQMSHEDITKILKTSIAIIDVFTKHVEDMRGIPVRDIYGPEQEEK